MPSIEALAISEPIKVDGLVDDAIWQQAPVASGFIQREPDEGQAATERTEFRVAYSNDTLYVAIVCFDSEPDKIIASEMQRDSFQVRDDSVIVFLDTFDDNRNGYMFETNVNGARTDVSFTDEGRSAYLFWDGVWRAESRRIPEGWSTEIAIPFATIRFDPSKEKWGINVRRLIRRKNEEVFWSPILRDANLWRVSLYGDLNGIKDLGRNRNVQVEPFAVATGLDTRSGLADDEEFDVGFDAKWTFTRNMNLDLTVNTDFAETEIDTLQFNLTRFPLFFPEKRAFFLENAGIMQFGLGNDRRIEINPLLVPFHPRRIGLTEDGREVPIDWGARFTGRAGPWSLGVLDMQTAATNFDDGEQVEQTNWGVLRVKRNVGRRSNVGMFFTSKDVKNGGYNRVYGVDVDYSPSRKLTLGAYALRSDDSDLESGNDWAFGGAAYYRGRNWGGDLDISQIEGRFNPGVGFISRSNVRRVYQRIAYQPRPKKKGRIRNYTFGVTTNTFLNLDNQVETGQIFLDILGISFRSGDDINFFIDRSFERLVEPFEIREGIVIDPGRYYFNTYGIQFETDDRRPFYASVTAETGEFYDGDLNGMLLTVGYRPNRFFRTEATWRINDIDLPRDSFDPNLFGQRFFVSFTPYIFLNTFIQFNDETEFARFNVRFGWNYRPGSDLYVVYQDNRQGSSFGSLDFDERRLTVKFSYWFQL